MKKQEHKFFSEAYRYKGEKLTQKSMKERILEARKADKELKKNINKRKDE